MRGKMKKKNAQLYPKSVRPESTSLSSTLASGSLSPPSRSSCYCSESCCDQGCVFVVSVLLGLGFARRAATFYDVEQIIKKTWRCVSHREPRVPTQALSFLIARCVILFYHLHAVSSREIFSFACFNKKDKYCAKAQHFSLITLSTLPIQSLPTSLILLHVSLFIQPRK